MDIAKTIITLRKKKGLSQAELAKLVKITQASISNIESGKKIPHKSTVEKICDKLQIPIQLFYMLATEDGDLPDESKEKYNSIAPNLKQLILDAF